MSAAFSKCVKPWVHPRTTQEQRKKWKEEGKEGGKKGEGGKREKKREGKFRPFYLLSESSDWLRNLHF